MIEFDETNGFDWYQTLGAPIGIVERQYLSLWTGHGITEDSFEDRDVIIRGKTVREMIVKPPATPPDFDKIVAMSHGINKIDFAEVSLIAISEEQIAARFFDCHQVVVSIAVFGIPTETYDNILASLDSAEWEVKFPFVVLEGDMVMFDSVEVGASIQDKDTYTFRLPPGKYQIQTANFDTEGYWTTVTRFTKV